MASKKTSSNRYVAILDFIFQSHYNNGAKELLFDRDEIAVAAKQHTFEVQALLKIVDATGLSAEELIQ